MGENVDLNKLSLEELQAAIEKKKREVKKSGAESLDWTKMSLEEVRAFVVNQALAAGKENPTFSDEFVKDYKRVQIEKQLEREEKEKEKNALIKDATMEQVYDWILKKNEGRFYISTEDLETLIVFDKCPYKLTQFCDVKRDKTTGKIIGVSFAVAHNGHVFTTQDEEHGNHYDMFVEKYVE